MDHIAKGHGKGEGTGMGVLPLAERRSQKQILIEICLEGYEHAQLHPRSLTSDLYFF